MTDTEPQVNRQIRFIENKNQYNHFLLDIMVENYYFKSERKPFKYPCIIVVNLPAGEVEFDYAVDGTGFAN